jgi:hypothetical protein
VDGLIEETDGRSHGCASAEIEFNADGGSLDPIHLHILYTTNEEGTIFARCLDLDLLAYAGSVEEADKRLFSMVIESIMDAAHDDRIDEMFEVKSDKRFWCEFNGMKYEHYRKTISDLKLLMSEDKRDLWVTKSPSKHVTYNFGRITVKKTDECIRLAA